MHIVFQQRQSLVKQQVDLALDEHVDLAQNEVHSLLDTISYFVIYSFIDVFEVVLHGGHVFSIVKRVLRRVVAVVLVLILARVARMTIAK